MRQIKKVYSISKKKATAKVITAICLSAFLLVGCGGGGSSNDPPDSPTSDDGPYDKSITYAVSSLAGEADKLTAMDKAQSTWRHVTPNHGASNMSASLEDVGQNMVEFGEHLAGLMTLTTDQLDGDFSCGTSSVSTGTGVSVEYNFDGSCDDISGAMSIQINPAESILFTYDNLMIADCAITGSVSYGYMDATAANGFQIAYDKLSVCDEVIDGSIGLIQGDDGNFTYDLGNSDYTFDDGGSNVTVTTNYLQFNNTGSTNGSLTVQLQGEESESVTINDVSMDAECGGVPTSGSITIEGSDNESILVDFSGTTCQNPIVTYTVEGTEYSMSLEIVEGSTDPADDDPADDDPADDDPADDDPADDDPADDDPADDSTTDVDMTGQWVGTVAIGDGASQSSEMVVQQDGNVVIRIGDSDDPVHQMSDDDATLTVEGSTAIITAAFDEDLTDPFNDETAYIFTGAVENGVFTGDITINGVEESGSFNLPLSNRE